MNTTYASLSNAFDTKSDAGNYAAHENELVGKSVLIVEDEGITQMQLRRMLTRAGMIVTGTAADGAAGVEAALQDRPEIILMDIRMPIMDGIEATRRIMEVYSPCVVVLTAFAGEEFAQKARSAGARGYVVKPVTSNVLMPQIHDVYRAYCEDEPPS